MTFQHHGLPPAPGGGAANVKEKRLIPAVASQLESAASRWGSGRSEGRGVVEALQSEFSVEGGEGVHMPKGVEAVTILDVTLAASDSIVGINRPCNQDTHLVTVQQQCSKSLVIRVNRADQEVHCYGHASDVYRGKLSSDGSPVALKALRALRISSPQRRKRMLENLFQRAQMWRTLTPNKHVLPFLGIAQSLSDPHSVPFIVTPWMERGNLRDHVYNLIRSNTLAKIELVSQARRWSYEIACGLTHLHSADIVHGGLRSANVFLTSDHSIYLADFGISSSRHSGDISGDPPLSPSPAAWMAPELFRDVKWISQPTAASDVFAFGRVVVELFSGNAPFPGLSEIVIMQQVLRGKRPARPQGIDDQFWKVVECCWDENPAKRPHARELVGTLSAGYQSKVGYLSQILATLTPPTLHSCGERIRMDLLEACKTGDLSSILRLRDSDAQYALDVLQEVLWGCCPGRYSLDTATRNDLRRLLLKLSIAWDHFPSSLFVTGTRCLNKDEYLPGGFADVYRGTHNQRDIALKRLRVFQSNDDLANQKLKKAFYLESITWKTLNHKHVLPFIGITQETFVTSPCMVLPWMDNGNAQDYVNTLRQRGRFSAALVGELLRQVILGVYYLHSEGIVHGDIRAVNILIDALGNALLTDFGLAVIDAGGASIRPSYGGNVRWLAPEMIDPEQHGIQPSESKPTPPADIYSFGCVCIELFTGEPPFGRLNELQVVRKLMRGEVPGRPNRKGEEMSDKLWSLVRQCWSKQPSDRPSAKHLVEVGITV